MREKEKAVYVDKHKNIFMVKGNTAGFRLTLKTPSGDPYDYSDDLVKLTVKTDIFTETVLLEKTFSDGRIVFDPSDTNTIDYGAYVYDIALQTPGGDFYTVIKEKDFVITGRVTSYAE